MPRKQQTAADYVVMALSPMLIMTLVGSLVFFLLQVMYQGNYQGRVQWMLFWFVFATVLIARIGIEQGRSYAAMYAGAMALACGLFASRFLSEYLVGTVFLLVVIWWCTDRLTWDCTFIDDSEDASGEGLLQQAGIEQKEEEPPAGPVETDKQRRRRLRREKLYPELAAAQRTAATEESPSDAAVKAKHKKSHAPGVWVVYFSLLALPLFGLGQARLPMDQPAVRTYGFQLLWVYVASALGLLLTTSFLGLRRYLRQRNLQMPPRITAAWLTSGAMIVLVIMLLCLVIPRPQADQSVTAWLDRFAAEHEASDHAMLGNDKGKGEGRRIGEQQQDPNAQQASAEGKGEPQNKEGEGEKTAANGEKQGKQQGDQQGEKSSDDKSSNDEKTAQNQKSPQKPSDDKPPQNDNRQAENNQQNNNADNDQRQAEKNDDKRQPNDDRDQQNENEKQQDKNRLAQNDEPKDEEKDDDKAEKNAGSSNSGSQPPPSQSPWMSKLANGLKWLIYIVCGLLILWALWKNRESILQGAAEFFQAIAAFWSSLFNWGQAKSKTKDRAEVVTQPGEPPRKRFADYPNPFLTGEAYRMRADALAIYTWEAFRAFGWEQGVRDDAEMTAIEFGRLVEVQLPELSRPINFLTQACSRILYSQRPPTDFDVKPLETLWQGMTQIARGSREPSPA